MKKKPFFKKLVTKQDYPDSALCAFARNTYIPLPTPKDKEEPKNVDSKNK